MRYIINCKINFKNLILFIAVLIIPCYENGMELKNIADIQSGYISRGKIEPMDNGSYFLLQARDVDADRLIYQAERMVRFNPDLSPKDQPLKQNDILFMARGSRNYAILLKEIPKPVLAAACFFIVRLFNRDVLPDYLFWYLNQAPADNYFRRHSGRGVHMPVVKRSVLENIDIPIPPVEEQKTISELNNLLQKEIALLEALAQKRKEMITAACLQVVQKKQK